LKSGNVISLRRFFALQPLRSKTLLRPDSSTPSDIVVRNVSLGYRTSADEVSTKVANAYSAASSVVPPATSLNAALQFAEKLAFGWRSALQRCDKVFVFCKGLGFG
jgi:hypothetical protein